VIRALRAAVAIALSTGFVACIDPSDQRPGLWLSGDPMQGFPESWSFSNDHREIAIEVQTPHLIPHSVTIWCAVVDDELYLGARNPEDKRWVGWVKRDPDVRLRIGETIFDAKLAVLDDADRTASVRAAYTEKYDLPASTESEGPPMRYWRVRPRG
jgi:hypothetical protein